VSLTLLAADVSLFLVCAALRMSAGAPAPGATAAARPALAASGGRPFAWVLLLLLLTHGSTLLSALSPAVPNPAAALDLASRGGKVHVSFCTS
jgi:hypothetical protein